MNLGTSTPANFDYNLSNLFCEFWWYTSNTSAGNLNTPISLGSITTNASSYRLQVRLNSGFQANFSTAISNTTPLSASTWYHFAVSVDSTNKFIYLFVNGNGTASPVSYTGSLTYTSTQSVAIGYSNALALNYYYDQYIRDLRVVQGGVVPTTSFTPSAAPFSYALPSYVTGSGSTVFTLLGQFVTYVPGKYNQSVVFTNTAGSTATNALTYTLSPITSLTSGFTIACWFKINSVPPSGQRSGIWRIPATGTGNGGAYMLYYASGQTNFGYTQTDQAIPYVEFSANFGTLAVGTWYHAVYTISGTTQTAYLNGVLKATDTRLTATYTLTNPTMSLGFHGSFFDAFNGELDDLRIYNTALNAAQVQSVYSQGAAPASGFRVMPLPKYAWTFDGTMTDYVTGLAPSGSNVVTNNFSSGMYLQAANIYNTSNTFWGNNIYYNLTTPIPVPFSISFWFRMNTNWVTSGNPTGGLVAVIRCLNAFIVKVSLDSAAATRIQFSINDSASNTRITYSIPAGLGVWTFFAASVTSTGATCYAQNVASSSMTTVILSPGTGVTFDKSISTVGNQYGDASGGAVQSSLPFNGLIDDLRVFNTALIAAQVQSIYNTQGMPSRGVQVKQYIKSATGGDTVQDIGGYRIHTFTTVGTSTFTPATSGLVEVLIVAGGGGGGGCASNQTAGGGGAGEVYYKQNYTVSSGALTVTVGNGGTGGNGTTTTAATAGANSVFGSLTCAGGGKGGDRAINVNAGGAGGSGGGAARLTVTGALGGASTATIGFGNKGGNTSATDTNGAGGGGALGAGSNGDSSGTRPPGGPGASYSISGTTVSYGSGGVGGLRAGSSNGADASANTGNGGGGGDGNAVTNGGAGGSGIVIVRYPISGPVNMTGSPLFSQLSAAAASSAVGAFSLRAVNGVSTRAVQVRPVAVFPPGVFTATSTVISGLSYSQYLTGYPFGGTGTYTSNSSSGTGASTRSWRAFDGVIGSNGGRWVSDGTYTVNTPYTGTQKTTVAGVDYPGEWLQLQLPQAIVLSSYSIYPQSTNIPATWNVFASNDGTTWTVIDQRGTQTLVQNQYNNYTISGSPAAYSYYRIGCYIVSLNVAFAIVEMRLFGSNASWNTDFWADRRGNLLTAPVTGTTLANWLGGATGYVTTWYDQSGRGNHASQATVANQPVIQRATKGPGYCTLWTGTAGPRLVYGTSSNLFDGTNYTVCVVAKRNAAISGATYYAGTNGQAVQNQSLAVGYNTDTALRHSEYSYSNNGPTVPAYAGASEPVGYDFFAFSQTASSGFRDYSWRSGTQYTSGNNTLTLPLTNSGNATIGWAVSASNGNSFNGEIYEVLVFTSSLYDFDGTSTITQIYQNQLSYTGT
jgi:hypothetical protein